MTVDPYACLDAVCLLGALDADERLAYRVSRSFPGCTVTVSGCDAPHRSMATAA
jgi:hypothetical protein